MDNNKALKTQLKRALFGLCPNCGKGKLFAKYLKQVDSCSNCNESFGDIRADDGPAWLTIMLVGHIVIPVLLLVYPNPPWPDWQIMGVLSVFTVVLTLVLLPWCKGFFIGVIWRLKCVGSEEK